MNWLNTHLRNLFHAAADLVEQHPDAVVTALRFVAGVAAKAIPAAGVAIGVGEQVIEQIIGAPVTTTTTTTTAAPAPPQP